MLSHQKNSGAGTIIMSKDSDGKETDVTNPAFNAWSLTEQQVLGFLLSSMGKESISQVRACCTSAKTWTAIKGNFTSATRARTVNSKISLATTKKGDLSIAT
jgi:hypothetical protein